MNFNNIINKHILYDGDHSFAWKSIPTHFCHVFVVTISWRKQNFPTRFKKDTRLVKGWNDICWTIHMFE
jgi:hypothetical protein